MAKEKTVLVNFRIPVSIYKEFSENVQKNHLEPSMTSAVIRMIDAYNKKQKKSR